MKKSFLERSSLFRGLLSLVLLVAMVGNAWGADEAITLNSGVYSGSGTTGQIVWSGTSCSITQTKGSSSTNVSSSYVSAPRWYQSHIISFSANTGYTITGATVVCTSSAYATALKNSTYSTGASASVSSSTVTITSSGDFTITMGAQSRISSITVHYTTGGSTPAALSEPNNLSSSNVTANSATLTWGAVTNASSYTLKIDDTEYANATSPFTATGLTASTKYTWSVKAIGDGTNYSSSEYSTNAEFTTSAPTFASLEELVAADITSGTTVTVSFSDVPIKSFYNSGNYTNGVFFDIQKDGKDIEIYYRNVPSEWEVGGTLSGTMTCPWTLYNETWELAPTSNSWNWTNLTYKAPQATTYSITIAQDIQNGYVSANQTSAEAGTEITLTATPAEGYQFKSWDVRTSSSSITVTDNKFLMPEANVTVSATFEEIPLSNLETIDITSNSIIDYELISNDSYQERNWIEKGIGGIVKVCYNENTPGYMQFQKDCYIYNSTPIPGKITSITLVFATGYEQTWEAYVSNSSYSGTLDTFSTLDTQKVSSSQNASWSIGSGEYSYFYIKNTTGYQRIEKIRIEYESTTTKTETSLTWKKDGVVVTSSTATINAANTYPTLFTTPENLTGIKYSSTNTDIASINATTGEITLNQAGSTNITAFYAGDDTYKASSATYTLTVEASAPQKVLIKWSDRGNIISQSEVSVGSTLQFPEDPSVENWTFMGWTASSSVASSGEGIEFINNESVAPEDGATYYAVFAQKEESSTGQYILDYDNEPGLSSSTAWGYGKPIEYTATDGGVWIVKGYKSKGIQLNTGKDASIKVPDCPNYITSIDITSSQQAKFNFSYEDYEGTDIKVITSAQGVNVTLNLSEANVTTGYIWTSNATSITKVVVKFGEESFHNYTLYPTNPSKYDIIIDETIENGEVSSSATKAEEGDEITLTATPDEHYHFGSWTVLDSNDIEVIVSDDKFTMPASDVTVSATFIEDTKYTISWSVNKNITTAEVYENEPITFDTPTEEFDGFEFMGWSESEIEGTTDTRPDMISSATATGNKTYYAVYAEPVSPANDNLNSISSYADGTYYIVDIFDSKYYALSGLPNSNGAIIGVDITDNITINSDGSLSVTDLSDDNMKFSLSYANEKYTLKLGNDKISLKGKGNNLATPGAYDWTGFETGSYGNGRFSLTGTGTNSNGNPTQNCLLFQGTSAGQPTELFKGYTQGNRGVDNTSAQNYGSGYMWFIPVSGSSVTIYKNYWTTKPYDGTWNDIAIVGDFPNSGFATDTEPAKPIYLMTDMGNNKFSETIDAHDWENGKPYKFMLYNEETERGTTNYWGSNAVSIDFTDHNIETFTEGGSSGRMTWIHNEEYTSYYVVAEYVDYKWNVTVKGVKPGYYLPGTWVENGWDTSNENLKFDENGMLELELSENTDYSFKIFNASICKWYKNNDAFTADNTYSPKEFYEHTGFENSTLHTTDPGTYIFYLTWNEDGSIPSLAVRYPGDFYLPSSWNDWSTSENTAKFDKYGKLTQRITASNNYELQIFKASTNTWYGLNNGHLIESNVGNPWWFFSSQTNCKLDAPVTGDYVFTLKWRDDGQPCLEVEYPEYISLNIGTTGYATYYNSTQAYIMPNDCEGKVAYYDSKGNWKFETVYNGGDVVPADEALVLHSDNTGEKKLGCTTTDIEPYHKKDQNDLRGTDAQEQIPNDDNYYYYGFSKGHSGTANADKLGFYWRVEGGAAFVNGAHKAYLMVLKSRFNDNPAKAAGFAIDDLTDGISTIETIESGAIYNLNGQRINSPVRGQIYIMNGRKYIAK